MRSKLVRQIVAIIFLIAFLFIGYDYCFGITLDTKKGPVEFSHEIHFTALQDCQSCHNVEKITEKNVSHAFCRNCHKEMKQGPTKCKGCHVK